MFALSAVSWAGVKPKEDCLTDGAGRWRPNAKLDPNPPRGSVRHVMLHGDDKVLLFGVPSHWGAREGRRRPVCWQDAAGGEEPSRTGRAGRILGTSRPLQYCSRGKFAVTIERCVEKGRSIVVGPVCGFHCDNETVPTVV
ncbi:LOW QUALITY PROTEIN: hypothetical protein Dda_5499 [Drechslerella dactyloides]|uniref:Uncharacterized protein n=1 Tax=Drechslerella dactyloides TaxID=74499 RepID=A0AAD6NHL4_DREDA|nr:LOW QUALITY PROTEIN: hypothetical protein Dda_5499 [Drechslerella dactyloides]